MSSFLFLLRAWDGWTLDLGGHHSHAPHGVRSPDRGKQPSSGGRSRVVVFKSEKHGVLVSVWAETETDTEKRQGRAQKPTTGKPFSAMCQV